MLAEASATLASSLDLEATLRELARLLVPRFADACLVSLPSGEGQAERHEMAWATPDPEHPLLNGSILEIDDAELRDAIARVRTAGRPEVIERGLARTRGAADRVAARSDGAQRAARTAARAGPCAGRPDARDRVADAAASMPTRSRWLPSSPTRAATAIDNALLFRKIQDEDQRKNEFLAMLAHELRNPLAPISNAVHIIRVSADEPAKIAWARDVIARQLKQLVRLVDDLLDVSRITRGKIELKIDVVDVQQVVEAAIETSKPNIDGHRHTLSIQLPAETLHLRGDFARVSQILSNLINNAAKYTPRGGRISLSAARDDDAVVFRIRDSGVGIPPEYLVTIFEPFTQVDRSLARSNGGLGIGLTLVRRLVEMQGGTVVARSEGRNRGSEFTVRLPLAALVPADADVSTSLEPPSPAGLRVLVVDDNRDVADSTASVMRMNGCDVHVAYDGKAAIESVQRLKPDAVLLDIGLPTFDGYLVAEHIRAQPDNDGTMIVAVSGYGQEQDRARSKSVGFDYHVVKPIDPAALASLIGSLRLLRESSRGGARVAPVAGTGT